jgi:hypothetical protein
MVVKFNHVSNSRMSRMKSDRERVVQSGVLCFRRILSKGHLRLESSSGSKISGKMSLIRVIPCERSSSKCTSRFFAGMNGLRS